MRRIWYNPDRTVIPIEFESSDPSLVQRAMSKYFSLGICNSAGTFYDCASESEFLSMIPADRANRHKWRKHPTENRIIVDTSIPDLLNPKQLILDEIDSAATIASLKIILRKIV